MELSDALKPAEMFAALLRLPYHDGQDAAQEARIAVWKAWESGKYDPTYLRVVAKRGALHAVRGRSFGSGTHGGHNGRVKPQYFAEAPDSGESVTEWSDLEMDWALRGLTDREKAFVEGVSNGLTPTEIGRNLGLKSSTHAGRIWKRLRERLQQAWKETQV